MNKELKKRLIISGAILYATFWLFFIFKEKDPYESKSMYSKPTPENLRYSSEIIEIQLEPLLYEVSIPANHLWYVHKNTIYHSSRPSRFPWIRAETGFLLPDFKSKTVELENQFYKNGGKNLLLIQLMMKTGQGSQDDREFIAKLDKELDENIDYPKNSTLRYWSSSYRTDLKLEQFQLDHPIHGTEYYFKSDYIVIHCWNPPLSMIREVCESSFDINSDIAVEYFFPYNYLSQWRNIDDFVHETVSKYEINETKRSYSLKDVKSYLLSKILH